MNLTATVSGGFWQIWHQDNEWTEGRPDGTKATQRETTSPLGRDGFTDHALAGRNQKLSTIINMRVCVCV